MKNVLRMTEHIFAQHPRNVQYFSLLNRIRFHRFVKTYTNFFPHKLDYRVLTDNIPILTRLFMFMIETSRKRRRNRFSHENLVKHPIKIKNIKSTYYVIYCFFAYRIKSGKIRTKKKFILRKSISMRLANITVKCQQIRRYLRKNQMLNRCM